MWQKIAQNREPIALYTHELQSYDYSLGEAFLSKPEFKTNEGGLVMSLKEPGLIGSLETALLDKASHLFQIYNFLPKYVDKSELYHEELIKKVSCI